MTVGLRVTDVGVWVVSVGAAVEVVGTSVVSVGAPVVKVGAAVGGGGPHVSIPGSPTYPAGQTQKSPSSVLFKIAVDLHCVQVLL